MTPQRRSTDRVPPDGSAPPPPPIGWAAALAWLASNVTAGRVVAAAIIALVSVLAAAADFRTHPQRLAAAETRFRADSVSLVHLRSRAIADSVAIVALQRDRARADSLDAFVACWVRSQMRRVAPDACELLDPLPSSMQSRARPPPPAHPPEGGDP